MKKFLAAIILLWASAVSAQFNGCKAGFCPGNIFGGPSDTTLAILFDYANGKSYFNGVQNTLAVNSSNYLVTSNSQTNIVPYAGDLEPNTLWNQIGLGFSSTGVLAPDGTATAFKIVEDGSNGRHLLYAPGAAGFSIPAGGPITGVFVLKAAERGFAICTVQDNSGNNFFASVNLSTGAVSTVGSGFSGKTGTATYISGTSTSFGSGWWLFSITGTVDPAATAAFAALDVSITLGSNNYQGVAGSGIYAWSVDMLQGATGTIPIPSIGLPTTAQPTTQLLGSTWTQLPLTGVNALTITSGVLTNSTTVGQQAGYVNFNQNANINISRIGATWKFTNVGAGLTGAAAVVVWKTQPITTASPPNSGCHLSIGRSNWVYGKILNGNPVTTIASGTFSPALAYDTPLTVDVRFNGNTAIVNLPDGTIQIITDSDIGSQAGAWGTIEAFQNDASADDRIGFYSSWLK